MTRGGADGGGGVVDGGDVVNGCSVVNGSGVVVCFRHTKYRKKTNL